MWRFLRSRFSVISKRGSLFVALNWLFFGVVFVATLFGMVGYRGSIAWPVDEGPLLSQVRSLPLPLMAAYIFFFNLVASGFVLLTLSGLAFFALPVFFLFLRALLWSAIIAALPSGYFPAFLLVFILEGEAYVLASVAGIITGLSWLKPRLVYADQSMPRSESLRRASLECAHIYVWVVIFLLAAAIVEASTIVPLL